MVNVSLTSKAENALKSTTPAGWEFIQKILSSLSYEDKYSLANLLKKIKCELIGYLNPEMDMSEIIKNSVTNQPGLYKRMIKNIFPSGYEAKRQSSEKQKNIY